MQNHHYISSGVLDLEVIHDIFKDQKVLALSDESRVNIQKSRTYLNNKIKESDTPVYGINTGFGALCNVKITSEKLTELQENLVRSHACGTGDRVSKQVIKLMLLLKIQSLSYGNSGVAIETVERLIELYNNDFLPVIYEQGSLGASGDLAPLAHLALPLIGDGEVYFEGSVISGEELLDKMNWEPVKLQSKEGLALLNGTQFMSAHGVYALMEAYKLSYMADLIKPILPYFVILTASSSSFPKVYHLELCYLDNKPLRLQLMVKRDGLTEQDLRKHPGTPVHKLQVKNHCYKVQ